jgi:ferredoxin
MLAIEVHRCQGCGTCVRVCSHGALSLVGQVAQIDFSLCHECLDCVDVCPSGAIRIVVSRPETREASLNTDR